MGWNELTDREKTIIALAAYQLSNRQIALLLGISQRTVEQHRERGRTNLGIGARADFGEMLAPHLLEIVKLAVPVMLRFIEGVVAHLNADLLWAESGCPCLTDLAKAKNDGD